MKRTASALVLTLIFTSTVSAATFGPLVEATELSASLKTASPVLLDIRAKGYEEAHADGAISAPYGIFRGPPENPGQLVDIEELEVSLETLGLEQHEPIVIISDGASSSDFGAAARVYWTLKSTGFSDLAILNGGQAAWQAAGLPINADIESPAPSELELTFDDTWLARTEDVAKVVNGDNVAVLVDARPAEFYEGKQAHDAAKRPGTVPGAINQSHASFFAAESAAISPAPHAAKLLKDLGITGQEEVISFCNTGHWAATHWFAVSELAGIANAKLYAGSMVEYSNENLPMDNTPGLIENLFKQFGG